MPRWRRSPPGCGGSARSSRRRFAAEAEAEAATVQARAILGAARAAVRAAEEMLEQHAAARGWREAERRAQREIDEAAQTPSAADWHDAP